jgi:hypothetical protein
MNLYSPKGAHVDAADLKIFDRMKILRPYVLAGVVGSSLDNLKYIGQKELSMQKRTKALVEALTRALAINAPADPETQYELVSMEILGAVAQGLLLHSHDCLKASNVIAQKYKGPDLFHHFAVACNLIASEF